MEEWLNILNKISELRKNNRVLWFRGHNNSNFKLSSTLSRIDKDKCIVKTKERDIYNYFVNYGYMYIDQFANFKEWNTLFLMQHYGLPTRLLDWTDSFIKALYFANYGRDKNEEACIWALNPIKLNHECNKRGFYMREEESYNRVNLLTLDKIPNRIKVYCNYFEKDIEKINSFALFPNMSNERLRAQSGFFTVQGTDLLNLEDEYNEFIDNFLFKITLPSSTFIDSMNFLKVNGINYYSIYGGVEGLCRYIKDEIMEIKMNNLV